MIDLTITTGRLNIRLTWGKQKPAATAEATPTPVNAGYPMQVAPVGFARGRAVRTVR